MSGPAFLAHRLNCSLHVVGTGPGLLRPLPHLLPEGPQGRSPISVLDVALDEGAHNVAGAFAFPSGQILEVAFEVLVDPYAQLGHRWKRTCVRDCRKGLAQHVLPLYRRLVPSVLSTFFFIWSLPIQILDVTAKTSASTSASNSFAKTYFRHESPTTSCRDRGAQSASAQISQPLRPDSTTTFYVLISNSRKGQSSTFDVEVSHEDRPTK